MLNGKRSFFPSASIRSDLEHRTSFGSPDAKIRGKPSQTVLKNTLSISEMIATVLRKKNFYLDSPAIYCDRKMKLTFRGLDDISTRMAQNLVKVMRGPPGLRPNGDGDTVIAFVLNEEEKDEKIITLILATLKLGVTYMALNADSHQNELLRVLNVVKPVLLITGTAASNTEMQDTIEKIKKSISIATTQMDELWSNANVSSTVPSDMSIPLLDISDPEYWSDIPFAERIVAIFFTSGSSGSPHGIRVGGREIFNRQHWESKVFPVENTDAYALTSSVTDPRSLTQILTALLAGKPLTIISLVDLEDPSKFISKISEVKLTRITVTPPVFEKVMDLVASNPNYKNQLLSVTHWTVSGNAVSVDSCRKFFQLFKGAYKAGIFLITMYGTTEVFGEATFEVFFNSTDLENKICPGSRTLSSGVPISNSSVAIVDNRDKNLPLGEKGEIVISGVCLSSGGYVGQGNWTLSKFNVNNRASNLEDKQHHVLFRTGDTGRILLDSNGVRRLYVEGRIDSTLKIGGQTMNLSVLSDQIMSTGLVKETIVFTYHRGRDNQIIVAASVLREGVTVLMVMTKLRLIILNPNSLVPQVFAVDSIPLMKNGRIDKKELRSVYRNSMLECNESQWKAMEDKNVDLKDLTTVKFACKAIALSLGIPLTQVISSSFEQSFWDIGGSALNSIMTLKICTDNGYPISMTDFVSAGSLRQLVDRISESANQPETFQNEEIEGKFSFDFMSTDNEDEVIRILKDDCCNADMPIIESLSLYWKTLINSILSLKLCIVAKMQIKNVDVIVGVAINGDADSNLKLPKPPKEIAYGLELLETCQAASRYQMWRRTNGRVAQSYFIGIKESLLSPGESAILIEQLLSRTCTAVRSARFSAIVLTTANPLIQEAATHLLQFESLLEFPVSRFKAKDKNRPFTFADDHHNASVLIKNVSWEEQSSLSHISSGISTLSSITTKSASLTSQVRFRS